MKFPYKVGAVVRATRTITEGGSGHRPNPRAAFPASNYVHAFKGHWGSVVYIDKKGNPTVMFHPRGTSTVVFEEEVEFLMEHDPEIILPRDVAIFLLRYGLLPECKGVIACKEYTPEDEDFVEIMPNEWKNILEDKDYQTFILWTKMPQEVEPEE